MELTVTIKYFILKKITKNIIQKYIKAHQIELFPTQAKLCIPIIDRLYKKMSAGINFSGIKVNNGLICDGHHRYIAALLANFKLEQIPSSITSATILGKWDSVIFENEDWDTEAKINMLNEVDSLYNNIALEKIVEILK